MIKLTSLIPEIVSNPIIYLGKYLQQSDQEKELEIAYDFYDQLIEFLNEFEHDGVEIPEDIKEDEYKLVEWLKKNRPDILKDFARRIESEIDQYIDMGRGPGFPSWKYVDFENYIKNQWLIHFSDHASDVAYNGFKIGMQSLETLGLTTFWKHGSSEKKYGGYNFAYQIKDFERYGLDSRGTGTWKYGSEAVLFRASGVRVWHHGDEEPQVIFWGPSANSIVYLRQYNVSWYVENLKTGNTIYSNEDLSTVVDWVVANYNQYKSVISVK